MQIAILSIILLCSLVGCKSPPPSFPKDVTTVKDLRFEERMDVEGNPILLPHCFEIEIVSKDPIKLGDFWEVDVLQCEGLMGFTAKSFNKVVQWGNDTQDWAKQHCKK